MVLWALGTACAGLGGEDNAHHSIEGGQEHSMVGREVAGAVAALSSVIGANRYYYHYL